MLTLVADIFPSEGISNIPTTITFSNNSTLKLNPTLFLSYVETEFENITCTDTFNIGGWSFIVGAYVRNNVTVVNDTYYEEVYWHYPNGTKTKISGANTMRLYVSFSVYRPTYEWKISLFGIPLMDLKSWWGYYVPCDIYASGNPLMLSNYVTTGPIRWNGYFGFEEPAGPLPWYKVESWLNWLGGVPNTMERHWMDLRYIDTYWQNETAAATFTVRNVDQGVSAEISFLYNRTQYVSAYDAFCGGGQIVWVVGLRPDQVKSHWDMFYVLNTLLTGSFPGLVYPFNVLVSFAFYACLILLVFALIVILLPWK
jgi:hypothetical protein